MKTALVTIFIAVASLGVAACDDSKPAPEPADDTLIEYRRTGGFVGLDDHLVIHTDGTATLERREGPATVTISEEEFDTIEEMVSELDWEALEGHHPPLDNILVADGYQYEFVYDDVIVTTETAGVPSELEPLISVLDSAATL